MLAALAADQLDRHLDAIVDTCSRVGSGDELLAQMSRRLRRVVPFDGACWFGTDPATLLATCPARIENIESGHCETYWQREFLVEDAILFRDLARAPRPAATLQMATDERPARSARYREFLAPQGYEDELRAVFRVGASAWGVVALLRERGRPAFDEHEVKLVASVSPAIGGALRTSALLRHPAPLEHPNAPGLLLFDRCGTLVSVNNEAERWLDEVPADVVPTGPLFDPSTGPSLPSAVVSVLARARSIAAGHERGPARLRLRSRTGRWLIVHASCLRGPDAAAGTTALVIEPAQSAEIAPIIVEAYSLTPREQEITRAIARGLDSAEIAETSHLSVHTVRDHVKAIFEKVGVSSRGELVAKLFADHYASPLHAAGPHLSSD